MLQITLPWKSVAFHARRRRVFQILLRRDELPTHARSLPTLHKHSEFSVTVHTVAEKCDNLSQKSATIAEEKEVALFCNSRTFLRQCGHGFMLYIHCVSKNA